MIKKIILKTDGGKQLLNRYIITYDKSFLGYYDKQYEYKAYIVAKNEEEAKQKLIDGYKSPYTFEIKIINIELENDNLMTREKMIYQINKYMSSDNRKKIIKILKRINRLNKKDNDYVRTRDIIVLAYHLLLTHTKIENVNTTEKGIKELENLIDGLFNGELIENE